MICYEIYLTMTTTFSYFCTVMNIRLVCYKFKNFNEFPKQMFDNGRKKR